MTTEICRFRADAFARGDAAAAAQGVAEASAAEAWERAKEAIARAEWADGERDHAFARAGEAERKSEAVLEESRDNYRERRAAEQCAHRARDDIARAEQEAGAAERRAEQAEARAQEAIDRADRAEQQAHADRAALERELGEQRDARQPRPVERGRVPPFAALRPARAGRSSSRGQTRRP